MWFGGIDQTEGEGVEEGEEREERDERGGRRARKMIGSSDGAEEKADVSDLQAS